MAGTVIKADLSLYDVSEILVWKGVVLLRGVISVNLIRERGLCCNLSLRHGVLHGHDLLWGYLRGKQIESCAILRRLGPDTISNEYLCILLKGIRRCTGVSLWVTHLFIRFGMRLRSYSDTLPKPMINIDYGPTLWHVMKYYVYYGHKDFILGLGCKTDMILVEQPFQRLIQEC